MLRFHPDFCTDTPGELTTIAILRRLPNLPKVPPFLRGQAVIGIAACWCGDIEQGERVLAPLRGFSTPLMDGISLKRYTAHQSMFDAGNPHGRYNYWKSAYLEELSDGAIDFFDWADEMEIGGSLDIEPIHVAAWVELKTRSFEP